MIITKLIGGLGNQMFQYASAYGIAKRHNTSVAVDTSWYEEHNSVLWTMGYELDNFTISGKTITPSHYRTGVSRVNWLRALLGKKRYKEYTESGLPFDPAVFEAGDDLLLNGYFQSEKYFKDVREDILKEFTFKEAPSGQNIEIAKLIGSTRAVSLHVRRGDYANNAKVTATHGLMGLDYYRAAIKSITDRFDDVHFFVFSDEPEWCKENLKIEQPHTFVSGNEKGYQDMQLMSMCNHHILANSSFSWWGAWLNPKSDKIIIAPKKWFSDPSLDSKDLVPESWERI